MYSYNWIVGKNQRKGKTEVPRDFLNSKSGNKPSSGEIGLNIRTIASPNVGQMQGNFHISMKTVHVYMSFFQGRGHAYELLYYVKGLIIWLCE